MKLGNIDIRKAYMGSRELTAANAFIGTTPIVPSAPTTRDYLTFTCVEAGSVGMTNYGNNAPNIEYSLNGGTWTTWDYSTITMTVGDKVKMRGHNENGFSTSSSNYSKFTMSGKIAASGNIMSLIDGEKDGTKIIPSDYCFYCILEQCESLISPPDLPATTLNYFCYSSMFWGCKNMTSAPELPSTNLESYCYYCMFYGCTSLTSAPVLPATDITYYCYNSMFHGCSSLTTAPSLPATTLYQGCYSFMFEGCSNLISAPELPATIIANNCYYGMFNNCTSLVSAPQSLPATTIAEFCYYSMFNGCTSLIYAPLLPATTLKNYCYWSMFRGCTSLVNAPELHAQTLVMSCYENMFYGCSSLKYIKCDASNISDFHCTYEWTKGVSETGTFTKAAGVQWPTGASGIPSGWTVKEKGHLTLTAIESGTIGIINLNNSPNIQYKKNNGSWTNWDYSSISVSAGDVIRMKGINPNGFNQGTTHFSKLYFTNKVAASGNIMSLIDGEIEGTTTIPNSYCFYFLFFGCTQLTTSPELPATTLTAHCYEQMFHGCTSLASIQCLATNIAATDCLNNWAVGVASTGTFTKAAGVQWPSGDSGIPSGWTVIEQ